MRAHLGICNILLTFMLVDDLRFFYLPSPKCTAKCGEGLSRNEPRSFSCQKIVTDVSRFSKYRTQSSRMDQQSWSGGREPEVVVAGGREPAVVAAVAGNQHCVAKYL
mmetsp:Transcript_76904/g.207700  ORF Transcript_76904/g.207700 Transcript_76904/m.207700 type:complete len:107 (+) Transcript_76904:215-535(+)